MATNLRPLVYTHYLVSPSKDANLGLLKSQCIWKWLPLRLDGRGRSSPSCRSATLREKGELSSTELESQLIGALIGIQGRGKSASPQQLNEVESIIKKLEAMAGVPEPTKSDLIEGRWQLVFTTRPGTASPIQRTFTGVDSFSVFQEVYLQCDDPRVSNIVKFSETIGELIVQAAASSVDEKRILFQFDRAAFNLKFLPFKVPYPVPFRLLGDKAKGWLDTTYLSETGNLRISRGSKGTTFVLQKKVAPRQTLLSMISTGTRAAEMVEEFLASNKLGEDDELPLDEGEWQVVWNSQMTTESPIENSANGLTGKQIVSKEGNIKFVTDVMYGVKFLRTGTYLRTGKRKYEFRMDDMAVVVGPFGLPIEMQAMLIVEIL